MLRNLFVFIFIFLTYTAFSQYSISGTITDKQGEPLAGANVILKNSEIGMATDLYGKFQIKKLPAGNYVITISYIGYETQQVNISLTTNNTTDISLKKSPVLADEIIVQAVRNGNSSTLANTSVSKDVIEKGNLGQDIPFLLALTPSITTTSDAGAGVGYTGIRVRGTDANRINITVNGIPMNDAESHGVWWVNMPDFASSVENIQIQRGVGTSTNGAGAFGATINMQTDKLKENPYAEISSSAGSFNTYKNTARLGTGLIANHFAFDMRLSKITSDGYIDRASSDLKSFYFSGGYFSKNTIIKAVIFSGKEKTYQSWWGVPKVRLENDTAGMMRYEEHGLYTHEETQYMLGSNSRTYNYYTYPNQTDNYQQDHYQLFFSHNFGNLILNAALHYTYGRGYYEEYRDEDALSNYGLNNLFIGGDTIANINLVRQKWLDNDFYGFTFSASYKAGNFNTILGGACNEYDGRHFGKIIWGQYLGDTEKDYQWYNSTGVKTDANIYSKTTVSLSDMTNLFVDLQYRQIKHNIKGMDDNMRDDTQNHQYGFFNPKAGFSIKPSDNQTIDLFYAIGHREPNRSNFIDASPDGPKPKPEEMQDWELGYKYTGYRFSGSANLYYMLYRDQLILTGDINDVGSAIMTNVKDSYREGIELNAGVKITGNLTWNANATFSLNKIKNFTEYVDNWDLWAQDTTYLGTTNIAFSPEIIANSIITYSPVKNLTASFISQYVGKQYIDNTSSNNRMLDPYFVNNLSLEYKLNVKGIKEIDFQFLVNNIFNTMYESNAWVYSYIYGGERYAMDGYFPQAGTNFLGGISLKF